MNIQLRPIQQNSITDKENYFSLQKSVAILQVLKHDNEEELNEWSWQNAFENENRICYVIEKMPGNIYCGECAVKNICDDIPEIEIELMKEYQGQGIGYQSVVIMLNKLAVEYGKDNYYAKVEPDNYVSHFLFEKLGGQPIGILRDYEISDERVKQFTEDHKELLDKNIEEIAKKFGVEAELLLTHLLVYKMNIQDLNVRNTSMEKSTHLNHREKINCKRELSRAKHIDVMKEWVEELMQMRETVNKDDLDVLLEQMKNRLLNRVDRVKESIHWNE